MVELASNYFEISMILKILRNLEDEITEKCKNSFENDDKNFSSMKPLHIYISLEDILVIII